MIYRKLRKILPQINNPVIVEIGAHLGTDTVKIAKMLKKPYTYFAIEPDQRNFHRLGPVCDRIGAQLIPAAIGNKDDIVPFWLSYGDNGKRVHTDSNSLKRPVRCAARPKHVKFELRSVVCFRLDWIFGVYKLEHIDLIWMDVQGAELDVFEGAKIALQNTDYIYTECQQGRYDRQPGLDGILKALPGWGIVLKNGENVLLRSKDAQE